MRGAFTLIELLVVMVIMVLVVGMVGPQGAKLLDDFKKYEKNEQEMQQLSKERSMCFLQAKEKTLNILNTTYHISSKGVLTKYEKSDDND